MNPERRRSLCILVLTFAAIAALVATILTLVGIEHNPQGEFSTDDDFPSISVRKVIFFWGTNFLIFFLPPALIATVIVLWAEVIAGYRSTKNLDDGDR